MKSKNVVWITPIYENNETNMYQYLNTTMVIKQVKQKIFYQNAF